MANLHVEIVYGDAEKQTVIPLSVPPGTTAQAAILQSGMLERWPEIDLSSQKIGCFGKIISLDTPLKNLDRIEIYRPLFLDPKQARKLRGGK